MRVWCGKFYNYIVKEVFYIVYTCNVIHCELTVITKCYNKNNPLNIGPNGPIGSAFILTIGKFAIDPSKIPVKINMLVRFLYNQEVDM